MRDEYDLMIVGGGLAGNCLALALRDSGLSVAIVEANTRGRSGFQELARNLRRNHEGSHLSQCQVRVYVDRATQFFARS